MNRHGDHDATCYCCKNVYMEYEGDLSDITPGAGFTFGCHEGYFYYSQYNLDRDDDFGAVLHGVMTMALGCQDFAGREK